MRRSAPATHEVLRLVEELAADIGLVVHQRPAGALVETPGNGAVVKVYLANWGTVDVPLQPLRDRGWTREAETALRKLQGFTAKTLTEKNPTFPTSDALSHWTGPREILVDIADLYLRSE